MENKLYKTIQHIYNMLEERIKLASSIQTESAYIVVLTFIKENFKNINEDSIIISKEEYKELLYLKRDKILKDKDDDFYKEVYKPFAIRIFDSRKHDVEINRIEDLIENLKTF